MIAAALDEISWLCFAAFVSVFNRGSLEKRRSWSNYSSAFTAFNLKQLGEKSLDLASVVT